MAWIESHQALRDHPKVRHLARLLNVDYDSALGKLHRFWYWCIDYAEDGDLRKYGMDVITDSMGYDAKALETSRLVDYDPYLRVHDWWDWSGRYWQSKYKNVPEKWHRIKSLYQVGSKSVLLTGHIPTDLPTNLQTVQRTPTRSLNVPEGKVQHLDYVWLTPEEFKKLKENFQTTNTNPQAFIDRLNGYIGQIGERRAAAKYKSHYHTILNWLRGDIEKGLVRRVRPQPKQVITPQTPPSDITDEEAREMHQQFTDQLGKCKPDKECKWCNPKESEAKNDKPK